MLKKFLLHCIAAVMLLILLPLCSDAGQWTKVDAVTLRFEGPIETNDIDQFNDLIDDGITTIIVMSGGGDTLAALPIAEIIQRRQLNIIVDGICGSSCANYFFIAAHEKTVPPGSLVMWHGGLTPKLRHGSREMKAYMRRAGMPPQQIKRQFQSWREGAARERMLYQKAGVDMALLDYSSVVTQRAYDFWAPPPDTLRELGVGNIISFWYPASANELNKLANRLRSNYYRRFRKTAAPPLNILGGDLCRPDP